MTVGKGPNNLGPYLQSGTFLTVNSQYFSLHTMTKPAVRTPGPRLWRAKATTVGRTYTGGHIHSGKLSINRRQIETATLAISRPWL